MAKRKRPSNEDEERKFWSRQDSAELVNWEQAKEVSLPELRPSLRTISLRLPAFMLDDLKRLAHKRDVPYQSLIKILLAESLKRESEGDAA
jgi:predicted DNA binding CopG/RHH family protein